MLEIEIFDMQLTRLKMWLWEWRVVEYGMKVKAAKVKSTDTKFSEDTLQSKNSRTTLWNDRLLPDDTRNLNRKKGSTSSYFSVTEDELPGGQNMTVMKGEAKYFLVFESNKLLSLGFNNFFINWFIQSISWKSFEWSTLFLPPSIGLLLCPVMIPFSSILSRVAFF